ncbi:MAG: segregation/condensation protein A [Deltaproteobacteria bacterium]|nr:segregation/condensation protein A [Deltaproteobacteria bacterium]
MTRTEDAIYEVELPEFEGPLDLLLHLVRRHELEIMDIPIAFVTEKYLEYLDLMQALSLDVAGEYLLMAATLAYIKSRELLPKQDDEIEDDEDEEAGNPKEELIRRLLNYQRYKHVAEGLAERPALGRQVYPRGAEMEKVDPKDRPLAEAGLFELVSALSDVMSRSKIKISYDVIVDRVSMGDRINEIVDRLDKPDNVRFVDCFSFEGTSEQVRHEVVVTFLAILEMAKLNMLRIMQHVDTGEIYLSRTESLRQVGVLDTTYA